MHFELSQVKVAFKVMKWHTSQLTDAPDFNIE
jgi:hypothetical protein